jgi:hypothetical protein
MLDRQSCSARRLARMTRSSRSFLLNGFIILSLILVIFTTGCLGPSSPEATGRPGEEDPFIEKSPPSDIQDRELPIQSRDFLVGTAGLIARNYPDSTEKDYRDFLEELPLTGELVGVYADWAAPDLIESIRFVDLFAEGVDPLVALGFNIDLVDDDYFSRNLPEIKRVIQSVLEEFDLDYLAIGVEVNRLIPEVSQEAFLDFVRVYNQIYELVKEISPQTKVFTIYQLEYLKGGAYLSGREFDPQWETLDLFAGKLDLLGLTVYPFLEYPSVEDIPSDYYDDIPQQIDLPIAITEMAWLSEDVLVVKGNQEDQVAYFLQLLEATQNWNLEMMLYSFLYEPRGADLFESAALKTNQGDPKEIYHYWLALAALK